MTQIQDKREAIFEATLKLVAEKGFHGTAMSKVSKESGVSIGTIYHYFPSKDELIVELYKHMKKESAAAILDGFDWDRPLRAQIRDIWERIFRYYLDKPQLAAFTSIYVTSPYATECIEEEVQHDFMPVIECFNKARREMIVKDLPHAVMGTLTVDVACSLVKKQEVGLIKLTDEIIAQTIDALWEAIRA